MPDLTVVPFTPNLDAEHHRAEVMRILEEALSAARSGDIRTVAVVMVSEGEVGGVMDCWHNGGHAYVMLGALESLKVDYVTALYTAPLRWVSVQAELGRSASPISCRSCRNRGKSKILMRA